jgi:hypothetical protein
MSIYKLLKEGKITPEEAKELAADMKAVFGEMRKWTGHVATNVHRNARRKK